MRQRREAGLAFLMGLVGGLLLLAMPSALLVTSFAQEGEGEIHSLSAPIPSASGYINSSELGMAFINSAQAPASESRIRRGVDSGARMDRFPFYWGELEPSEGNFNWAAHDNVVRANERQGLGTLAILMGTPGQYYPNGTNPQPTDVPFPVGEGPLPVDDEAGASAVTTCGSGQPPPRSLYEPIWTDGTDTPGPNKSVNSGNPWARFVYHTVDRYSPGGGAGTNVRYWEIWNEPDLCFFWSGSAQEYARLLKVAYLVIEQVDPSATVIWGGLAHFERERFLQELVNELSRDPLAGTYNGFFDAATSHQYSNVREGYRLTARVRTALRGAGWGDKPIWITESGVPVCDDYPGPGCPSFYRATPEEQAAYIWQNIAYTRVAGGGPIFHFQLHDDAGNGPDSSGRCWDAFGLVKNSSSLHCAPANEEHRPAYRAYQLAAQYLSNTEVLWQEFQSNGAYQVAFYDPATKERRLLIWQREGYDTTGQIVATGGEARIISIDGSEERRTPADGRYEIALPRATNKNLPNNDTPEVEYDYSEVFTIGGRPYLVIERDTLPPVPTMTPLPPNSPETFEIRWDVGDRGSGVANVDIWIQIDNGDWEEWLPDQPAKGSTWVEGRLGQRYRFGIQATDRAGNSLNAAIPLIETLISNETPSVRVWGEVRNTRGEPIRNVPISIGPANGSTDDQGNYSLDVTAGTWDVTVDGRVLHRGMTFNQETHLPLTIVPDDIVRVRGEVRNMLSQPLPNVPFTIGSVRVVSDLTGRFDLWIPKGQADVTLDGRVLHRGMQFNQETYLSLLVPPSSASPVRNGGFDTNLDGWTVGGNGAAGAEDRPNYGRALRLGTEFVAQPGVEGEDGSSGGNTTVSQVVTLPRGNPSLTFAYKIDTAETAPRATSDRLEVIVYYTEGGQTKARYLYNEQRAVPWIYYFHNLSEWAGQQVTIVFNLYQSSPNRPTSAWIDEVMIGESAPVTQWKPLFLPLLHRR
ncbi:MAG TPA: hypothetical protein VF707_04520 [Ardenticatenaceae bacterium]